MGVFSEQQALYAVVMVCLALVLMMVITLILMYRRSAAAEKQAKEMAAIVQEKLSQTSEAERINEEQARREIGETVRNVNDSLVQDDGRNDPHAAKDRWTQLGGQLRAAGRQEEERMERMRQTMAQR